jgi:hypothetical protein
MLHRLKGILSILVLVTGDALHIRDIAVYSLSSAGLPPSLTPNGEPPTLSLVEERVIRGQMVAWAQPLATAGRFFAVIEDGKFIEEWLERKNCSIHRHSRGSPFFSPSHGEYGGGTDISTNLTTSGSMDAPVLRGSARCSNGLQIILTSCISAHWGTHSPCCKAEAAMLHFHLKFRHLRGSSHPKWLVLAEDDHVIDVKGVLATLEYFNESLPMTLGETQFHDFTPFKGHPPPNPRFGSQKQNKTKISICFSKRREPNPYNIFPYRNPSIWTSTAIGRMALGLAAGGLRHQCEETGLTHDVVIGVLAWLYSLPHVTYWSGCFAGGEPGQSGLESHTSLLQCLESARQEMLASNTSMLGSGRKCMPSTQVIAHKMKDSAKQILAGTFMEKTSVGQKQIEDCLRLGGTRIPPANPSAPKTGHDYLRLVHQIGYSRTLHFSRGNSTHDLSRLIDSSGKWRTFTMADCAEGEELLLPVSDSISRDGARSRWAGQLALKDLYREGERDEVLGLYDRVRLESLVNY